MLFLTIFAALGLSGIERHNFVCQHLIAPFMLSGRSLSLDVEGFAGLPMEAFEKLELHTNGKAPRIVRSLNELRGNVLIDTPARALAFVRLRTSPTTWFVFQAPRLELMERSRLDLQFTFGDKNELRALKTDEFDFAGVTSHHLPVLGKYPKVDLANGHFEVKRLLFSAGKKNVDVDEVTEEVDTDGRWRILSDRHLDPHPFKRLDLFFPIFE